MQAYPERAIRANSYRACCAHSKIEMLHAYGDLDGEALPSLGQSHATMAAFEQSKAEGLFEELNPPAGGRLADAQCVDSMVEVQMLDDRQGTGSTRSAECAHF